MDTMNATPRRLRSALEVVRDISLTIMALSISIVIILGLKYGTIEGDGLSDLVKYGQPTVEPCEDFPDAPGC